MSTTKIEGISTGLGYVGTVPYSGKANEAEADEQGNNIYNSYVKFLGDYKEYKNETLSAGVYFVHWFDGANGFDGLIRYDGVNKSGCFLGVSLASSGAEVMYNFAEITAAGKMRCMTAIHGSTYAENTKLKIYYIKVV